MSMATDGTHKMKCPLPTIVNGEQQNCTVCFGKVNTWLTIANIQIECGYPLKVTQQSVDGMLNIVAALKTCNGIQASDFTSKTFISENVAMIHNNSTHSRQRSKSCKLILTWCARNDTCEPCLHSYKNHTDRIKKKRKREIGIGKENVIKKTCVDQLKEGNTLVDSVDGEIGMDTISTAKICSETLKDITVGKHVTNQSNSKHATDDNNEDRCENAIKLSEEDHDDMENILQLVLKANVPENFVLLLKSQLNNCQKGLEVHQRRWDPKIISTCLTLFLRSPQAYEDLKKSGFLELPSKRLLQYYKNSVKQTPGFNEANLTWMMKEAEKKNVSEFGRHGGLVLDEMSIQDDLIITKSGDTWNLVGFVDMDTTNNNIDIICNGEKKVQLATHALQYVFHGLAGFRWPVAYFGSYPATAHQLYTTFWKCVDLLDEHGFTVDYVMADGASTNRTFTNMLFQGSPRESNFIFPDVFFKGHHMCAIQDIMHVLKKIRNNIESSRGINKTGSGRYMVLNDKCIVWDHWMECFNSNFQNGFALHYKLTDEHINLTPASKMRNQLAIQVLNRDMLYLMKSYQETLPNPDILASSIQLLEHTSQLVDIFCTKNKPVSSMDSPQFATMRKVLDFFNSWEETIHKSVMYIGSKNLITRETREDINSSVMGFISLCQLMLKNGNTITPGYVNSDLVENLFGQQRGVRNGLNTNPTLAQYGPSNTAIILGQCSISNKSNSGQPASFFKATTPCALNPNRNKANSLKKRGIRL